MDTLSADILTLIIEHIQNDSYIGFFSLKNLARTTNALNHLCRPFLFKFLKVNVDADCEKASLQFLTFIIGAPEVHRHVSRLTIYGDGSPEGPSRRCLDLVHRILNFPNLEEVIIGGDPYGISCTPALTHLLRAADLTLLENLPPRVKVCINSYTYTTDAPCVSVHRLHNLSALRVCAFDILRFSHLVTPTSFGRDIASIFRNNTGLRSLHLIMHKPRLPNPTTREEFIELAPDAIFQCGSALSSTKITSLVLEGPLVSSHHRCWDVWEPCFDRLTSISVSGWNPIALVCGKFAHCLRNLQELNLNVGVTHWASPYQDFVRAICPVPFIACGCEGQKPPGPTVNGLLRLLQGLKLRHLSLVGLHPQILRHALHRSGPTLLSLRFAILQHRPRTGDLDPEWLEYIGATCPKLEWLGINGSRDDLVSLASGDFDDKATKPLIRLKPLLQYQCLRSFSIFIPEKVNEDWNLSGSEIVHAFQKLRDGKIGCQLASLEVICRNRLWTANGLEKGRALLQSYRREDWRENPNVKMEVWDVQPMVPCQSWTEHRWMPPKFEFGLSKYEIEGGPDLFKIGGLYRPGDEILRARIRRQLEQNRDMDFSSMFHGFFRST